jgi:hypothetical protein
VEAQAAAAAAVAAGDDDDGAAAVEETREQRQQRQDAVLQQFLQEAAPVVHWSSSCVDIWRDVWAGHRKSMGAAASSSHPAGGSGGDGITTNGDRSLHEAAQPSAAEPEAVAAAVTPARKKPVRAPRVVADVVESVIGAVFVDRAAGGAEDAAHAWQHVWHTVQRLLQLPDRR